MSSTTPKQMFLSQRWLGLLLVVVEDTTQDVLVGFQARKLSLQDVLGAPSLNGFRKRLDNHLFRIILGLLLESFQPYHSMFSVPNSFPSNMKSLRRRHSPENSNLWTYLENCSLQCLLRSYGGLAENYPALFTLHGKP